MRSLPAPAGSIACQEPSLWKVTVLQAGTVKTVRPLSSARMAIGSVVRLMIVARFGPMLQAIAIGTASQTRTHDRTGAGRFSAASPGP